MARRTGASAKAQALAKATEAVARRDAERIEREKRLQSTLAEFFHAQGEAARIRMAADEAAAPFDAAMSTAVRSLDSLGETRAGIVSLTGLPLTRVREYLADAVATSATATREADTHDDSVLHHNSGPAIAKRQQSAAAATTAGKAML